MFLRSPVRSLLILSFASFLIETVQQITAVGVPDPSDFVANTSGALLGSLAAAVLLVIRRIARRR
jgi:glycopeptide antibiotics resistance protein